LVSTIGSEGLDENDSNLLCHRIGVFLAVGIVSCGSDNVVTPGPSVGISSTTLEFPAGTDQTTFNVSNNGGSLLTWELIPDKDWILVDKAKGTGPAKATVSVDRGHDDLSNPSPTPYKGVIAVNTNGGSNGSGTRAADSRRAAVHTF